MKTYFKNVNTWYFVYCNLIRCIFDIALSACLPWTWYWFVVNLTWSASRNEYVYKHSSSQFIKGLMRQHNCFIFIRETSIDKIIPTLWENLSCNNEILFIVLMILHDFLYWSIGSQGRGQGYQVCFPNMARHAIMPYRIFRWFPMLQHTT